MDEAQDEADVVIVGTGAAGAVLAARLSERPELTVCLVEAGAEPSDPRIGDPGAWPLLQGSAIDWAFETTPQVGTANRVHAWPRGRVVGGSTALHAMGHMRGHPADFDAWVAAGATGWDFAALLPYFMRSETSPFSGEPGYGGKGPLALCQPASPHPLTSAHIAACEAVGLAPIRDHNGPHMAGPTRNTLTLAHGRRVRATAYLTAAVRARTNLQIRTRTLADRVTFDASGRAVGLEIVVAGGRQTLTARRAVVVSAGTIGTPAVLIRSGIGPAGTLRALGIPVRADSPCVGENLSDHLLAAGNVYRASSGAAVPDAALRKPVLCPRARAKSVGGARAGGGDRDAAAGERCPKVSSAATSTGRRLHTDVLHHPSEKPGAAHPHEPRTGCKTDDRSGLP